jgi:hypothetical protein
MEKKTETIYIKSVVSMEIVTEYRVLDTDKLVEKLKERGVTRVEDLFNEYDNFGYNLMDELDRDELIEMVDYETGEIIEAEPALYLWACGDLGGDPELSKLLDTISENQ